TVPAKTENRRFELDDLARVVRVADPQIAPDARSVVIVVSRANLDEDRYDAELVQVDVASGTRRTLAAGRRAINFPRWSPDGKQLAFLAMDGDGRGAHAQVFVVPAGGGDAGQITTTTMGAQQVAWSPDGTSIAYTTADDPEKKSGPERFNDSFEI